MEDWRIPYKPEQYTTSEATGELFPDVIAWEKELTASERSYFLEHLVTYKNPKNDNEKLCNLQAEYLRTQSKKAESELWINCLQIARKLINKEQKEKHFQMDSDTKEDKALEAVEYVIRRYFKHYLKQRNIGRMITQYWSIQTSFLNALYGGVKHALYYDGGQKQTIKIEYVGTMTDALQFKADKEAEQCY